MVAATATYDQLRKQRLEENKRRMQELNINKLCDSLKKSIHPKTKPKKKVKSRETKLGLAPVRRSSRDVDKPNYDEEAFDLFERSNRKHCSVDGLNQTHERRDLLYPNYASKYDRMEAIQRAKDLESGLDSQFPSFVKPMLQSHLTGCFRLPLPAHFCKSHLPYHDEAITLEDEDERQSETKYHAARYELSGGWRGFCLDHDLVDGDALVFHLVKPTVFKVYIIQADEAEETNQDKDDMNDKKVDLVEKISKKAKPEKNVASVEKRSTRTRSEPCCVDGLNRTYKRRDLLYRNYASKYDRMEAIQRAKDLESGLDSQFPSFVKPMLQSHVTGRFWLPLPAHFCKSHLPYHDEAITLEDEDERQSETKYLIARHGLSGGWRGFCLGHDLVDGDALVFHLVTPTVFKVYIIRADEAEGTNEDKDDMNDKSKIW